MCCPWQEVEARCRAAEGKVDQVQDTAASGSWTQRHAVSPGTLGQQPGMTANPLFGEVSPGSIWTPMSVVDRQSSCTLLCTGNVSLGHGCITAKLFVGVQDPSPGKDSDRGATHSGSASELASLRAQLAAAEKERDSARQRFAR